MREVPYVDPYRIDGRRDRGDILDDFREFLTARTKRYPIDRGNKRTRIGYDTYDTYNRPLDKDTKEERIMKLLMTEGYSDNHFDNHEAIELVENMYHVKDGKKYIGEKYDIHKAKEVCERYKEILPDDVEPYDIYVAINAQYHDYCNVYTSWFDGNIDNKVFESAIMFWFKDSDFDGDKLWEYFHMN